MSDYIKLAEAPVFMFQSPQCGTCSVDLEWEDGHVCPVCGTYWPGDATDGDEGELFESWSGEELDGETVDEDGAFQAGLRHDRAKVDELIKKMGIKR